MVQIFFKILDVPFTNTWMYDVSVIIVIVLVVFFLIQRRIMIQAQVQKTLREKVREKTKELEEEKERAEHSEKAKEQFLANMSHEIRSPMNAILGMTRLLLEKNARPDQLYYLNSIKHASDNLLVIINDILDLSKIEAGKITFESIGFNLENVIKDIYSIQKISADEKQLELSYVIEKNVPLNLTGDPYRLNQILLNLVTNAIKFTEKGFVEMYVKCIENKNGKALLHFDVNDSGIGIAKDKLDFIFNMFTQESSSTTRKFGGTGLGLAISKRLIELQGGNISVKSETGKGSVFSFEIMYGLNKETEQTAEETERINRQKIRLENLKILLAEDNEFNRVVAQETLEGLIKGVEIDTAKTGIEVIEKTAQKKYDLILMDIQMPEMDGHEATKILRANSNPAINSIPVIAMTASVIKAEVQKCFESGMNEFVGKPFKPEELIDKIVKVLKQ